MTNYCILTITNTTFLCPHLLLLCILFILYPSVVITWLDFISSENVKQKNPRRQSLRGQSRHSKLQEKYRFPVRVAMETTCRTCSCVHTHSHPQPTHLYTDNYRHCIITTIALNCLEYLLNC